MNDRNAQPPEPPDCITDARRVARILGPSSAAAQAVKRYDALKAASQPTRMLETKTMWLVEDAHQPTDGISSMGTSFPKDKPT